MAFDSCFTFDTCDARYVQVENELFKRTLIVCDLTSLWDEEEEESGRSGNGRPLFLILLKKIKIKIGPYVICGQRRKASNLNRATVGLSRWSSREVEWKVGLAGGREVVSAFRGGREVAVPSEFAVDILMGDQLSCHQVASYSSL